MCVKVDRRITIEKSLYTEWKGRVAIIITRVALKLGDNWFPSPWRAEKASVGAIRNTSHEKLTKELWAGSDRIGSARLCIAGR